MKRTYQPKRRPRKGQTAEIPNTPECTYERRIGPPKSVESEEVEEEAAVA